MRYYGVCLILAALAADIQALTPYKMASLQTSCPIGTVSAGPCTIFGQCTAGSTCYRRWYGPGQCCRSSQFAVSGSCTYGDSGFSCNIYTPYTCPIGTTCQSSGGWFPFSFGAGRCCNNGNFATQSCPSGSPGPPCGGLAGIPCSAGYSCRYSSTNQHIADRPGVCCLNAATAGEKPGICPANNVIGICVITANHCLTDSNCPFTWKCCSHGCGKECKPPLMYTIG